MRIVNENFETINESDVDLTKGYFSKGIAIRKDAEPIDYVKKFAWSDEDYEDVMVYRLREKIPIDIPTEEPSPTDELTQVIDALLGVGGDQNG